MASKKSHMVERDKSATGKAPGVRPGQNSPLTFARPSDMSAQDAVNQPAAAGIEIDDPSAYNARFAGKKKGVPCL